MKNPSKSRSRKIRLRVSLAAGLVALLAGGVGMLDCSLTRAPIQGQRLATMQDSDTWDTERDRFVNPLPRASFRIWASIKKMIRGKEHARPSEAIPVMERGAIDFATAPASGLRVTWLGHSTTLVEIDGARVLLDPVWSERPSPIDGVGPKRFHRTPLPLEELLEIDLDAVVISHDHYDHLDRDTIEALRDHVPLFVTPLGVGTYLEAWGVDPARIVERDWWGEAKVGPLTLVATPARHFSGRSMVMANQDRTLWAGWAILGPKHRVYFSGDSGMFPGFAEIGARLGPFDVSLIECGAYDELWADVHLGPEQALAAHAMVRGGVFIPVHWGTFDLANHNWTEPAERAIVEARRRNIPISIPRPGGSVEPANKTPLERWWPSLPWQSAEEAPVVSSGLRLALTGATSAN